MGDRSLLKMRAGPALLVDHAITNGSQGRGDVKSHSFEWSYLRNIFLFGKVDGVGPRRPPLSVLLERIAMW